MQRRGPEVCGPHGGVVLCSIRDGSRICPMIEDVVDFALTSRRFCSGGTTKKTSPRPQEQPHEEPQRDSSRHSSHSLPSPSCDGVSPNRPTSFCPNCDLATAAARCRGAPRPPLPVLAPHRNVDRRRVTSAEIKEKYSTIKKWYMLTNCCLKNSMTLFCTGEDAYNIRITGLQEKLPRARLTFP